MPLFAAVADATCCYISGRVDMLLLPYAISFDTLPPLLAMPCYAICYAAAAIFLLTDVDIAITLLYAYAARDILPCC